MGFSPKPRADISQIAKRRLVIGGLKGFLGIFSALTLIAVIWLASVGGKENRFNLSFSSIEQAGDQPVMIAPRFEGMDKAGNPFIVTAHKALQTGTNSADLTEVHANIALTSGEFVNITSRRGYIDMEAQQIILQMEVEMHHSNGTSFYADDTVIKLKEKYAFSKKPVRGQDQHSDLWALGFELWMDEERLAFAPQARMVIRKEAL